VNNKKVIIVGPAHPYRGGIANFNDCLAKEYARQGCDVQVFSFKLQYPEFFFPGKTQYEKSDPPKDILIKSIINSINPFNWISVAKKIIKEKPDFLIVRYWLPFMAPCLGTICYLIKSKTKIIAITDNVIPHEKRFGDFLLTKYFVGSCHAFITLSKSVLDDLSRFTKTKDKKFIAHPIYDTFGEIVKKEEAIKILDIGTGATCIYPLLGVAVHNWNFVGVDIDLDSLDTAQDIIDDNDLDAHIKLRQQLDENQILKGILEDDDFFSAVMCNPPFYKSAEEAQGANKRKNKNLGNSAVRNFSGNNNELWYVGGEKAFLHNYLYESSLYKDKSTWFTSLVSKKENVESMEKSSKKLGATAFKVIPMSQGNKVTRIVCWKY